MNKLAVSPSSGEIITKKTIWINGAPEEIELRQCDRLDTEYYEVYLRGGETTYCISGRNYDRITNAIYDGAKFVRINDDLVNVNEIKRFRKVK